MKKLIRQAIRKIYFGGAFAFDNRVGMHNVEDDYRVQLLGDRDLLLHKNDKPIMLTQKCQYLAPFYFEIPNVCESVGDTVVANEIEQMTNATEGIFVLDVDNCLGTICEIMYMLSIGKKVTIVAIEDLTQTESRYQTAGWFTITLAEQIYQQLVNVIICKEDEILSKVKNLIGME